MTSDTKPTLQDRALRRVRRLLDLAENQGSSEAERENAMSQAMQLMSDYGINEAMANARGQVREKIIKKVISLGNPYSYDKAQLLGWIGAELNCQQINHTSGSVYLRSTVIGYESDVARTEMLYTTLLLQAMRELQHARPPWPYPTPAETRKYRRNWFFGFNYRVALRIRESEKQAAQKFEREHAADNTGTALVLADRKTQVAAKVDEFFPPDDLAKFRARDRGGDGITEGKRAGDRGDIGNGKVKSGDQYKIGPGRG